MNADTLLQEANKLGTEASKQTGVAFNPITPTAQKPITPESLTPATPLTIPQLPANTAASSITSQSQPIVDVLKKELADEQAAKDAEVKTQEGTVQSLIDKYISKKTADIAEAEGDVNTPDTMAWQRAQKTKLAAKIDSSTRAEDLEIRNLDNQLLSPEQKNTEIAAINRKYAREQADLQLSYNVATNSLADMETTLNKKLELELEPLKMNLDFQTKIYEQVQGDLTKAQDRAWTQKIKTMNDQADQIRTDKTAVNKALLDAKERGAVISPELAVKLANAKDLTEFNQIAIANGVSLVKPETAKEIQPLSILDIQRYQELYPDSGVQAGDSEAQANAKVAASNTPEAKTRNLIVGAKDNGSDYATVVKEINGDKSIKDKSAALAIAKEVYAVKETEGVNSEIENEISQLSKNGILNNGDIRASLKSRGYTNAEINASSVGNIIDKIGQFLFGE